MLVNFHLEVTSQSEFQYPGNYTVTVYTNNATKKRTVIPIIMPNYGMFNSVSFKCSAKKKFFFKKINN